MKRTLILLAIATTLFCAPLVQAQTPVFELDLQPLSSESVEWTISSGGLEISKHIYGNFSLSITNDDFVDRVVFQIESQTWNDSSDPFSFEFNTENFTVGEYTIIVTAYTSDNVTDSQEVTYNFEHEDNSSDALPYPTFDSSPLVIGVVVVIVILGIVCLISKR